MRVPAFGLSTNRSMDFLHGTFSLTLQHHVYISSHRLRYDLKSFDFPFSLLRIAMKVKITLFSLLLILAPAGVSQGQYSQQQLDRWLQRFPDADADRDGKLTLEEASRYRRKLQQGTKNTGGGRGVPREFNVDPGWQAQRFPDHAVCYKSPEEIADLYAGVARGNRQPIIRYPKPDDGSLRIVGTGHSFMAPGFKSFPKITAAAGLKQPPLLTHTGGGITGSARYKWEQENGIFQFDGKPLPRLLASIANSQWDAMMWGPYYHDRPAYYACWIDFCLKYNPEMKFYLSDAWPQLEQLKEIPASEEELTMEVFEQMGREKYKTYSTLIRSLNKDYPDKVFVMPTSDAMVLAVQYYHRDRLPGVEGIHKVVGKKERSLWRDRLGHLGPGLGRLEGYVFYATLYGRSPELISGDVSAGEEYPSADLDRVFRKIAWEAVLRNPFSGVTDKNSNGVGDRHE